MGANPWPNNLPMFAYAEMLSAPEKLLAAYFNSSTVGVGVLDADLHYIIINKTLAKMSGLPAEDHIGRTVGEVLRGAADFVEPALRRVLASGEPHSNFEVSAHLATGKEAGQWLCHFFPILDEAGKVTRVGIVAVDITQQKRSEENLQRLTSTLKSKGERLQLLIDVGKLLSSNRDLRHLFPQISARIRRVLQQEYAGFSLHDSKTGLLVRQAEDFPLGKGLTTAVQISASNSPGATSIEARSPLIFNREQLERFNAEIAQRFVAEGMRSLCCVPLLRPAGALGVLVLGSTRTDAFQYQDLELLNQVAAQFAVALENRRTAEEIDGLRQRLDQERKYLEGEIRSEGHFTEIIGDSLPLKHVLDQVRTVAASDATVLILGETGTGKELVARAIHRLSRRNDAGFIKMNCAAIPTGLLESELFGHEKGAFTGAVTQKVGRLELADGGTLFLDEVGEIALELQPKLLRVLQDREFERLGSTRTIKVNVRLITATNRNLLESVAEHKFRSDLYYRLHVFPIHVPPLRERREDIPLLVRFFVRRFAQRMNRSIETIPKETMNALMDWHWPGNVRELENLMERSVILSEGNALRVPIGELPLAAPAPTDESDSSLDTAERSHIVRILRETKGVLSGPHGAARRLGLKRTTLQSKMQRLNIKSSDYSEHS